MQIKILCSRAITTFTFFELLERIQYKIIFTLNVCKSHHLRWECGVSRLLNLFKLRKSVHILKSFGEVYDTSIIIIYSCRAYNCDESKTGLRLILGTVKRIVTLLFVSWKVFGVWHTLADVYEKERIKAIQRTCVNFVLPKNFTYFLNIKSLISNVGVQKSRSVVSLADFWGANFRGNAHQLS